MDKPTSEASRRSRRLRRNYLVLAGLEGVTVVLVDDDGIGNVLHRNILKCYAIHEALTSLNEGPILTIDGIHRELPASINFMKSAAAENNVADRYVTCHVLILRPVFVLVRTAPSTCTSVTLDHEFNLPKLPMLSINRRVRMLRSPTWLGNHRTRERVRMKDRCSPDSVARSARNVSDAYLGRSLPHGDAVLS